jgi:hypothetical protein
MFYPQSATMIFQPEQFSFPKFTLPAQLTPLLLSATGNAYRLQFVLMAIQVAGEPHTQLSSIHPIVFAPPLQIQAHGRGHNRVRSGL